MSRKLYALLLPVLAFAALAMTAGAAQAAVKWELCLHEHGGSATKYSDSECQNELTTGKWEWVPIPNGESNKKQIIIFGRLTFTSTITFTCKVLAGGNIWNLAAGGIDNIETFINYECSSASCTTLTTTAKGFNWPTETIAGPADKIGTAAKPIEILIDCNGTEELFKGELSPKLVNPTTTEPLKAEFTAATGELEGPGGAKAKVEGNTRLLGWEHGEQIKVK